MKNYNKLIDLKGQIKNKTAVIRIDANVPVVEGKITDDTRLLEVLPSIKFLLEEGVSRLCIISHFGRPKAQEEEFSLIQIKSHLEGLLAMKIEFCKDLKNIPNEKIVLCENLRYNKEEEKGGEEFAKTLSELGEIYVNDAFSCSHRSHASISVVSKFTKVYAGFLMMKEIESIESILSEKGRKSLAIVGGSKVSTKITLLENLISKIDCIFVAGGMANTFLYAKGFNIGASLCEKDLKETALKILANAEKSGCKIILPSDVIVCKKIHKFAPSKMVSIKEIAEDDIIVDAGSNSLLELKEILFKSEVFLWNGPLGVFEVPPFGVSTFSFAREVATATKKYGLKSIIGGGDTASAVLESGFKAEMTYISTAGGAFLEWLEGKELPGVAVCKIK
jgi:phosphoglycerate kinase